MESHVIQLTDLKAFVEKSEVSGDYVAEFNSLGDPTSQLMSMEAAHFPKNMIKHRYPQDNLGAYDDTRVLLSKIQGAEYSDYINANWIRGYDDKRKYIVTQAPIISTQSDFYRMIWENNIHQIIMLASVRDLEMNKCSKYFPESNETYGDIEVNFQRVSRYPEITQRIYSIKVGSIERPLVHYHFLSWPDQGVPSDPNQILKLIQFYRRSDTFCHKWPLLIHCSAGVGRTGSFVLSDLMFDMADEAGEVDFLKYLYLLRFQRISMIERPEQYLLPFKVILLAYEKGLFTKESTV